MPIVSYTGPGYYPKMVADVLNAAWDRGLANQTELETKIANATAGFLDVTDPPTMTAAQVASAPTVEEPAVAIPSTASTADVMSVFDSKYLELVALLSDKFVSFRSTYFPDEQNAYGAAEDWLQAAVNNPEVGLPATVASQIWGDDQARILQDTVRAADAVVQSFAARRFPLPPGAAASAVMQIQQKAQDELAESSRKVAMMSVEQMRFVVTNLLALRQQAMGAAIDYIKALASGPEMASRLIGIGYDAQSKLISAASQFYNARTSAAELKLKANMHNADLSQEASKANLQSELTLIEDKLKALLAEAQMLAQTATSLFNNLHASTSVSASLSESADVTGGAIT